MNNGTKSAISRMWNQTRNEERIAHVLNLDLSDVIAYLKTRRGYPTGIVLKGDRVRKSPRPLKAADAQFTKHGPTPRPTLPKLKFMEGSDV